MGQIIGNTRAGKKLPRFIQYVCTYGLQGRRVETDQPLARLAFGLGGEPAAVRALGLAAFALPPLLFLAAFDLPPRKQAQKPQTATRGEGGSSAGETRPADALYPAWPVERLRSTGTGLISLERWLSSSYTLPNETARRNVPLDRCSPTIDRRH